MSFIGIDLGTSFIKGAVLNLETHSLEHIRRIPFPGPVADRPALAYEVDPQQIINTFSAFLQEMLAHAPDCRGLVLCTQMHGLVLTRPDGQARSNFISWQDERVLTSQPGQKHSYFDTICQRLSEAEKRQLGRELKPSLPLGYLFWLAENGQLPDEAVVPASLPDFLLAQLGQTRPTIELTNAAAHGALNLETLDWHQGVIDKLALSHLPWPEIVPFDQPAYHLSFQGRTIPCYPAIGDHQCAMLGAFLQLGELSLNVATASQVTSLTPSLRLGEYQTRPFFAGHFMNTIARIPAGRSLNVLVNLLTELATAQQLKLEDPWAYIVEAVEAVGQTSLQVDLSFFTTSVGDRGAIANIREDNLTVGHLFKAAFESMAANYLLCARRLSPQQTPAQTWRNLVFSGGLLQKIEPLRDIVCATLGLDFRLTASEEDTLLGLLALALTVEGRAASIDEAIAILRTSFTKE